MEFMCDRGDCLKTFKNTHGLTKHLRLHDNDVIRCFFCQWVTGTPHELRPHLDHHFETPQYKCSKCGRAFFQKNNLDFHFEITHEIIKDKYRCKFCDYRTWSKNALFGHMRQHRR